MGKIVIASSSNFRQIHVPVVLTDSTTSEDFFLPLKENSQTYLDHLSTNGKRFILALADVPGITRIGVNINCVSLHLSPAYEWDEMRAEVLQITKSVLQLGSDLKVEDTTMAKLYPGVYPDTKTEEEDFISPLPQQSLELMVHVRDTDKIAAEKKGLNGAYINIEYPVVPHKGDFMDLHVQLEPLEVTKVLHYGGSFIEEWAQIHFEAPLSDVETLLAATEGNSFGVWEKHKP